MANARGAGLPALGEVMDGAKGNGWELRHGDWRQTLQDLPCVNALIADPPLAPRVHIGRRTGSDIRQANIDYTHLTEQDAIDIANQWHRRVSGWVILFCDHEAWRWHEAAWRAVGWYTFAPVPWVKEDAPPRMSGDGPASQVEWLMIARPVRRENAGSRPGFYLHKTAATRSNGESFPGAKPLELIKRIIADYTRAGDVVVDICSGSGTTARACRETGRVFIGSEIREEAFAKSVERIAAPLAQETVDRAIFADAERRKIRHAVPKAGVQQSLTTLLDA